MGRLDDGEDEGSDVMDIVGPVRRSMSSTSAGIFTSCVINC